MLPSILETHNYISMLLILHIAFLSISKYELLVNNITYAELILPPTIQHVPCKKEEMYTAVQHKLDKRSLGNKLNAKV